MAVRVRWVPLWGQHVIMISVDGDQFLTLDADTARQLAAELPRVLMTKPLADGDNGSDNHRP